MSQDMLFALILFALVSSITPGPNNLMLLASGANFGFRRTLPHMLGIGLGHMLMIVLVGLGLMQIFDAFPVSYTILKIASVLYMGYLAWKIATSGPSGAAETTGKPLTFLQAAAFQWVNPKAWAMALTAISVYTPRDQLSAVFLVAAVFASINLPSVSTWTVLGQQMARFLTRPGRLMAFNWTMAALLIASLYPILWP